MFKYLQEINIHVFSLFLSMRYLVLRHRSEYVITIAGFTISVDKFILLRSTCELLLYKA